MAERTDRRSEGRTRNQLASEGSELVQLVLDYAKQEILGPVKGLARFVIFGISGSVALSAGVAVLLLALLRLLQTETGSTFAGKLSWLPYVITTAVAVLVAGLAGWRVARGPARRSARASSREG